VAARGVSQLTIEEIAAQSGVAKTTIYRNWPDRTMLILDAVNAHFEHAGAPDTGTLHGDLEAFYLGVARADKDGYNARVMPCLVEAATRDPEMGALLERIGEQRTRIVLQIVERAQRRGELPDDLDPDVVVCSIIGPLVFQKLVRRRPVDAPFVARCLDVAVRGLGAVVSVD
jgi:AcrR family transcriptional regulator